MPSLMSRSISRSRSLSSGCPAKVLQHADILRVGVHRQGHHLHLRGLAETCRVTSIRSGRAGDRIWGVLFLDGKGLVDVDMGIALGSVQAVEQFASASSLASPFPPAMRGKTGPWSIGGFPGCQFWIFSPGQAVATKGGYSPSENTDWRQRVAGCPPFTEGVKTTESLTSSRHRIPPVRQGSPISWEGRRLSPERSVSAIGENEVAPRPRGGQDAVCGKSRGRGGAKILKRLPPGYPRAFGNGVARGR